MKKSVLALLASGIILIGACSPVTEPPPDNPPEVVPEPIPELPIAIPEPEPTPEANPEPPAEEEPPSVPVKAEVGFRAPDFKMQNPDGSMVSLSDIDKPVIINFWHTRCRPCRDEMPLLEQVQNDLQSELTLLPVNTGQSPSKVTEFLAVNNLKLSVLIDSGGTISANYLVRYVPTTYFIDTDGIIRDKIVGAFPNRAAIDRSIVKIMPTTE